MKHNRLIKYHPQIVKLSPDGKTIALLYHGDRKIGFFNLETGREICTLEHEVYEPLVIEFSSDGKTIIFGGCDEIGLLKFFDKEEWKNNTSVACFLLLQNIHSVLTSEKRVIDLKKFPKLLEIYDKLLEKNEQKIVDTFLSSSRPSNIQLHRCIEISYTNRRGETSIGDIVPVKKPYWRKTESDEQAQNMLKVWDIGRHNYCEYALKDIKFIQ